MPLSTEKICLLVYTLATIVWMTRLPDDRYLVHAEFSSESQERDQKTDTYFSNRKDAELKYWQLVLGSVDSSEEHSPPE